MHVFMLDIGYGLVTAAILALSAVAFTLEYAVSRVANLAHGEILTEPYGSGLAFRDPDGIALELFVSGRNA